MASDDDLVSLGPWPLGVDNRSASHRIKPGAARDAKDVTIRADGSVTLRDGFDNKDSTAMHSLWPQVPIPGIDFMLGVRGTTLVKITRTAAGALSFTNLRTGMADRNYPVSYVCIDGIVYYSNGLVSGRVIDGADWAWGVGTYVYPHRGQNGKCVGSTVNIGATCANPVPYGYTLRPNKRVRRSP